MRRKTVSGIMLSLLLLGMLIWTFNIQPVSASVTIYIKADGSVQGTDKIQRDGNLYTFTDNIINQLIIVERDDIVIDGAIYTLQGAGSGYGFDLTTRSNVTIQNTNIKGFNVGVKLWTYSHHNTISRNSITNNNWHGIQLHESSNNNISGNTIKNNNAYSGVWLEYSSNNTVSGNTITNNTKGSDGFGVRLWAWSSHNTVSGNNITKNIVGVGLNAWSDNITISGNNIIDNTNYGVSLSHSSYSIVSGNTIKNSARGIRVADSLDNHIYHNNLMNNTQQVYDAYWDDPEHFFPSINIWDDGYPSGGNYWSDYTGEDLFSGPYQDEIDSDGIGDTPYVIDANNQDNYPLMSPLRVCAEPETIYVDDDNTTGPWDGTSEHPYQNITSALENASANDTIYVYNGTYSERVIVDKSVSIIGEGEKAKTTIISDSSNSTVYVSANNMTVSGFEIQTSILGLGGWGILLDHSSNSTISGNTVKSTNAISVNGGSRNKISDNRVVEPSYSCVFRGLWLSSSSNNIVTGNYLSPGCHEAFYMERSDHNYVAFNYIANHFTSYVLDIRRSNNNLIRCNDVFHGIGSIGGDFFFEESNSNVVYHNNFLSDWLERIEMIDSASINNTWDNGCPSGGNYWADYNGTDLYTGPYQNETGSDNIGDTPYVIGVNNQDNYPLMIPYPCIHSVAVKDVRPSKTVIGQNFTTRIPVDIANEGHFIENFNVTIYANTTIINTLTNITLASTNSATITFTWNTTGFVKGNYTITANATIVPNETYTDDNIYTYRIVVVTIPGDVNGNSKVNFEDLFRLADAYGSTPDDDNWDPECDINCNDRVEFEDLFTLADHYGLDTG